MARLLKVKLKNKSVNDVGSMSLCSLTENVPNYYFVTLLNSDLLFDYYREYINCTVNIQINDIRQLPILLPSAKELEFIKPKFDKAISLKKSVAKNFATDFEIEKELAKTEQELNNFVAKLYSV